MGKAKSSVGILRFMGDLYFSIVPSDNSEAFHFHDFGPNGKYREYLMGLRVVTRMPAGASCFPKKTHTPWIVWGNISESRKNTEASTNRSNTSIVSKKPKETQKQRHTTMISRITMIVGPAIHAVVKLMAFPDN